MLIVLIIVFIIFLFLKNNCKNTYITKSGKTYHASSLQNAEIIDVLRLISIDLSYEIDEENGRELRGKLQNTSFLELIDKDDDILAWNYDKGREIGIKMYDDNGKYYSAEFLIDSLFHELAHSITGSFGHTQEWVENEKILLKFKDKYVKILLNKTVLVY